jgi:uncharacterized Zn finger protein (UPF0148 family)
MKTELSIKCDECGRNRNKLVEKEGKLVCFYCINGVEDERKKDTKKI